MKRPGISFVLPMYNEAENIEHTLKVLASIARDMSDDYEIVVVDDASTDGSGGIVTRLAASDSRIRSIRLERNTKFGGALNKGLMSATKDIVVYTDSDLPVKASDMKEALKLLDEADVVTAYSLVIKDSSIKRIIMSKTYNFLVRLLFRLNIKDVNSGFKIYKRKVLDGLHVRSRSPFIDVEIFSEALRKDFTIASYGLIFELRTKGVSTISRLPIVMRTFYDMLAYWCLRQWR